MVEQSKKGKNLECRPEFKMVKDRRADNANKFQPEYVEQARKICALGAVDIEIADFFNVTVPTIFNWRHKYPKFEEACRVGKKPCNARAERSLYHRSVGFWYEEEKVYCFWDAEKKKVHEHRTTVRKFVIPDSSAAVQWLKIREPEKYHAIQEAFEAGHADTRPALEELLRLFYRHYDTQRDTTPPLITVNGGSDGGH
jgi:hypothetical protein